MRESVGERRRDRERERGVGYKDGLSIRKVIQDTRKRRRRSNISR